MPSEQRDGFEFKGFLSEAAEGLVILIPDHLIRTHGLAAGMHIHVTVRLEATE